MILRPRNIARWLAKPILLHWLLPYLMLLVVIGTVAQKTIGLYESQRLFFSSFLLWVGWFPLPGARAVCAVLFISLMSKVLLASPWSKAKSGIFITHVGILLLLLGGLLTAAFSDEGYMVLERHQTDHQFYDYHDRVLTVRKNAAPIITLPINELTTGQRITDPSLPFTLAIQYLCENCTMAPRAATGETLHGSAQKVMLSRIANDIDHERNLAGVEIAIEGAGKDKDGLYIAFEPMKKQPAITIGADQYTITIGRLPHALPFSLQLLDAEKEVHPGTDMVRSYRSTVLLRDGAVQQRAEITMNHPLRYKGYTVYQSSFLSADAASPTSGVSFAVVRNSGRVFPYVASITVCIGLLIHLCLKLPHLIQRGRHVA
jgi:hypothetical protein